MAPDRPVGGGRGGPPARSGIIQRLPMELAAAGCALVAVDSGRSSRTGTGPAAPRRRALHLVAATGLLVVAQLAWQLG